MATIEKKSIAYHEAGHVLMHLLTEIEIASVNIIENSDQYGVVTSADYGMAPYYNKDMRDDTIRCFVGGDLAEEYYCLINHIKYDSDLSDADYYKINRLFYEGHHRFRYFESYEAYVYKLKMEVGRQIRKHWSFIEATATALLLKEQLTTNGITDLWTRYNT